MRSAEGFKSFALVIFDVAGVRCILRELKLAVLRRHGSAHALICLPRSLARRSTRRDVLQFQQARLQGILMQPLPQAVVRINGPALFPQRADGFIMNLG